MVVDTGVIHFDEQNIVHAAEALWAVGKPYHVWAFDSPMGSGKTTLISALCKILDVKDQVSSPTFSIINEYSGVAQEAGCVVYHMDLYRLRDLTEAIDAGVEHCLNQSRLPSVWCFVEWPAIVLPILPLPLLTVSITVADADVTKRTISWQLRENK
jgi:tRNA threonylcarbamoyladenosine biosynthesis protein TsaE